MREPGGSFDLVKNNKPCFVVRLMVTESAARIDHRTFVMPQPSRGMTPHKSDHAGTYLLFSQGLS